MVLDYIVVTAPSETSTLAFELEIRRSGILPDSSALLCVSDPATSRLGSGGGTLNALSYIPDSDLANKRVAVIHSGGESRRAPLHSVCGKCFASFNAELPEQSSPIALMILELLDFCKAIEGGFLLIASCDVLLDIVRDTTIVPQDAVSVVVVPESLETARNHGVVVTSDPLEQDSVSVVVTQYLQKPSIEDMISANAQITVNGRDHPSALIDTGVIIATGKAFQKLLSLMHLSPLDRCCHGPSAKAKPADAEPAFKLELYSHILLSLSFARGECDWNTYLQRQDLNNVDPSSGEGRALFGVWSILKDVRLFAVIIRSGHFAHLGTSAELLDLVTHASQADATKLSFFSRKFRLKRVVRSKLFGENDSKVEGIVINSMVASSVCTRATSMIEHSIITGEAFLGSRAIVSYVSGFLGRDLVVPGDTMMQLVKLNPKSGFADCEYCLIVLGLHDDVKGGFPSVKGSWLGRCWEEFFDASTLRPCDIWPRECMEKTLWTAKLFPVISLDTADPLKHEETKDLAFWVLGKTKFGNPDNWRITNRLSLSDIILCGSVDSMLSIRSFIAAAVDYSALQSIAESDLTTVSRILTEYLIAENCILSVHRTNASCYLLAIHLIRSILYTDLSLLPSALQLTPTNVSYSVPAVMDVYTVTSEMFLRHQGLGCSLTMGTWKAKCCKNDLLKVVEHVLKIISYCEIIRPESYPRLLFILAWVLRGNAHHPDLVEAVGECANNIFPIQDISPEALETAAQSCVRSHLQSSLSERMPADHIPFPTPIQTTNPRRMVVATAPVRIDIAGGWSDTPPICYEASGAVFNVAVTVNNSRPICCVARFIPRREIVLRTYSRADSGVRLNEQVQCRSDSDLVQLLKCEGPNEPCVILRAALIALSFHELCMSCSYELQRVLDRVGGGFEVSSFSGLPAGSGMGGSSVLAAAIVTALNQLWGNSGMSSSAVIDMVLAVEQVMTSGGGWQDQIGGIVGGFKLSRTDSFLPMNVFVDSVPPSPLFDSVFSSRVCLVYTGTQVANYFYLRHENY